MLHTCLLEEKGLEQQNDRYAICWSRPSRGTQVIMEDSQLSKNLNLKELYDFFGDDDLAKRLGSFLTGSTLGNIQA